MHELQVAKEIIDVVEREMIREGLTKVDTVAVRIGSLSCIHADALSFGFEAAIAGTPLDGANLTIEEVRTKARCNLCGRESEIELPLFVCSYCAGTDLEVIAGEELHIDYIIGE